LRFCSCLSREARHASPFRRFKTLAAQAAAASEQDRIEDAIALYTRALALRPSGRRAGGRLGTLQMTSRYAQAAQDFEKVISLNPGNGTAHAMLGCWPIQNSAEMKQL